MGDFFGLGLSGICAREHREIPEKYERFGKKSEKSEFKIDFFAPSTLLFNIRARTKYSPARDLHESPINQKTAVVGHKFFVPRHSEKSSYIRIPNIVKYINAPTHIILK